jgi:hypothetical protein
VGDAPEILFMMRRLFFVGLMALAASVALAADGWSRYQNDRYGYSLDIPAGFTAIREADNGDGGTATSGEGNATLAVWGTNLLIESFKGDAGQRLESAKADGWEISFKSIGAKSATFSGTKDDRILYVRGKPGCDGQAAYFQLEYDAAAKDALDLTVKRMAKGFSAKGECL